MQFGFCVPFYTKSKENILKLLYIEMVLSKLEKSELELIDALPTNFQLKYGRIQPKDLHIKYKSIDVKAHLKTIHAGLGYKTNTVKTTIGKPKTKVNVDKENVRSVI
jgi:hypothetical protein